MPRLKSGQAPSCRLHRQSGQAIVTLNRKDILLGKYGSLESKKKYGRLIAEWFAAGQSHAPLTAGAMHGILVSELIVQFLKHAETYYRLADGAASGEVRNFKDAVAMLNTLCGATVADDFGPLRLKAVREAMVKSGWSRNYVNRQISRVKFVFSSPWFYPSVGLKTK
jgi:hypothetical protein